MAVLIRLVDGTQVAIDPLKVYYTLDAKNPGTVFCGVFAGATKLGMKCCGRGGECGCGVSGGGTRGWCSTRDWSLEGGRGGGERVRTR